MIQFQELPEQMDGRTEGQTEGWTDHISQDLPATVGSPIFNGSALLTLP